MWALGATFVGAAIAAGPGLGLYGLDIIGGGLSFRNDDCPVWGLPVIMVY